MRYCSSCILFLAHDFMQPFLRSSLAVAYKALKTTMIISTLLPYSAVEIYDFPVYCILLVKYSSLRRLTIVFRFSSTLTFDGFKKAK